MACRAQENVVRIGFQDIDGDFLHGPSLIGCSGEDTPESGRTPAPFAAGSRKAVPFSQAAIDSKRLPEPGADMAKSGLET
jgi:hypothetical protein